jgi:polysaccharide deacetylase 2 family uncharacterized protein YibQ
VPRGRAGKARAAKARHTLLAVRLWLVAAAVLVVVALGAWELVASGRAGDVAARIVGPRDLSARAARIDAAVDAALVRLGISGVRSDVEEPATRRYRWTRWEKRGSLPAGAGIFECNLEITRAVRRAGGTVIRGQEDGPDWRGLKTLDLRLGVGGLETHHLVLKESSTPGAPRASGDGAPRVAIVIDDFGYADSDVVRGFLSFDAPLTVSVLPNCPYTTKIARAATDAGKEVLLHLPMQPDGYPEKDPGDGALLLKQSYAHIAELTRQAIAQVPGAVGVNNHMGSAFTRDRGRMRVVVSVIKSAGLFFVDSMTTPESMGIPEAERAEVPSVPNNMFIDSLLTEEGRLDVATQLRALEEIAVRRGSAVGIGHARRETLEALARAIPRMEERGIRFVFVSELARRALSAGAGK